MIPANRVTIDCTAVRTEEWLGEPLRDCWLLECRHLTVEVHRFDEADPPQEVSG